MASDTSNALNAIGTLIGYIGTEVATDDFFDRLLWPRRAYNGFSFRHAVRMALLMPMGGPLHKAALSTLDGFYKHGLYERGQLGHMLGTAFYRDTKLEYRVHSGGLGPEKEFVRSGLWVKAVMRTPFPRPRKYSEDEEGGLKIKPPVVRQKVCVGHLKLFAIPTGERYKTVATIFDDAGRPTLRTYLALFTTEISAIVISILVATVWKSPFASLWLLPLALKLISTVSAVDREQVLVPSRQAQRPSSLPTVHGNDDKLYEIRNPAGGFAVVEGPDDVVLQFFRHHGHPKRCKIREIIQIGMVVAFTLVFPIGLVCSTLWMNDSLQKIWVGYQLYTTLAMYVYRYAGGRLWATTEEQIGKAFLKAERTNGGEEMLIMLKGPGNTGIGAKLVRTCHGRYGEAKACVEDLIVRQKSTSPGSLSTSSTMCADAPNVETSKR
ncbi:hypothetical protein EJ04DRAFT_582079 [Polyplosphaeria fusca]|uniref:Uncharacterized protein n=1 Tax=Polyplosphaeria fusca TaxID=682080 RepID=A0A9P4QM66_9PLEO|nr:hypothetical protein EJ04DRAFT_582079 [Polyplosphaeria fusca]